MAVGFGFSVGDLVTSLKVIKDSIEAVKDTKGASADYAALIAEISSLQDAFETVGDLQLLHNASGKPQLAMDRAIGACQKCVEDFLLSIAKYQPHLRYHARGLTSSYRKIKWALCKKEDVALFRAKLERHTSSINMILIAFQAKQMIDSNGQPDGSASMTRAPSETQNQQTVDMLTHLSVEQRQCFQILMQQNRELMQNVHNLHRLLEMQMSIPPQVQLQQPVILLDAFGKIAPFHLDFIDSLETFTAVLKIRFRRAGVQEAGLSKLDNREFTIQESCDKRMLDLKKPWSSIFQPGQKVDMSMVFHRFACPPTTCPGCSRNNGDGFGQTQWYVLQSCLY